jgi:hypothetical protein
VRFDIYGGRGLIAIEVQRLLRLDSPDLRGLREFKRDYPPARCFVFYSGKTQPYFADIVAIPLGEALQDLHGILSGRWKEGF